MRRCTLLLALLPVVAGAQETLTLEYAQARALAADLELARQEALAAAGRERGVHVRQLDDPRVRLGASNLPVDTFALDQEPMTQLAVGVSQALPRGDTLALRGREADQRVAETEQAAAERRAALRREVAGLWLTAYEAQRRLDLLAETRALYRDLLPVLESGYRVGRSRQDDVVQVRVRLATLDDTQGRLEGEAAAARDGLALWLGEGAGLPLPEGLPDWLTPPSSAPPGAAADAVDGHPDLARLGAKLAQADTRVDLARQTYRPAFTVDARYGYREDRPDFLSVGVAMDLPLFTAKRQDRRLGEAQRRRAAARLALEDRHARLLADARAVRSEAASLAGRIATYRDEILPELAQVTRLVTADYQAGRGDFAALLRARQAEVDGREALLGLRVALARRLVTLRYLTGHPEEN
jgi:outer membrane protein TolC